MRRIARKFSATRAFMELKLKFMKTDPKKKYNRLSLLFGVPGIILQLLPSALGEAQNSSLANGAYFLGIILLIAGLAFYAKSKNRSGWWGLLGLINIVGILVLAVLKDRSSEVSEKQ